MESHLSVLLVSQESNIAQRVGAALEAGGGDVLGTGVCWDLAELTGHLAKEPARAVLVDISPQPARMLKELHGIIGRFYDSRFVVLADEQDDDLLFKSMEVGVRYFLTKEAVEADLVAVLQKLRISGPGGGAWGGSVTTVLSAGGGCGATTIAVNLASELQQMTSKPVLLIDMDYDYGAVATYLGLNGQYGIADVLDHGEDIDQALIRSSALSYRNGLDVLISPASIDFSATRRLELAHLGRTIETCKDAYVHCVIDAPRVPMEVAGCLAAASAFTYVVFQLQVKDVRVGCAIVSALPRQYGVSPEKIVPLASRYRARRHALLSLSEARGALGNMAIECVNNDYMSAVSAINYGQPLSQVAPRSTLRKDLQGLAEKIAHAREPQPV